MRPVLFSCHVMPCHRFLAPVKVVPFGCACALPMVIVVGMLLMVGALSMVAELPMVAVLPMAVVVPMVSVLPMVVELPFVRMLPMVVVLPLVFADPMHPCLRASSVSLSLIESRVLSFPTLENCPKMFLRTALHSDVPYTVSYGTGT